MTFDFTKTEFYVMCKQSSALNQSYTKDHQEKCRSELTKVKINGSREIAFNQNKGREDFDFEKVTQHSLFLLRSICVSNVQESFDFLKVTKQYFHVFLFPICISNVPVLSMLDH